MNRLLRKLRRERSETGGRRKSPGQLNYEEEWDDRLQPDEEDEDEEGERLHAHRPSPESHRAGALPPFKSSWSSPAVFQETGRTGVSPLPQRSASTPSVSGGGGEGGGEDDEEEQLRWAIAESIHDEGERKRREAREMRQLMRELREAEDIERRRAALLRQLKEEEKAKYTGMVGRVNEGRESQNEERQLRLAMEMSLADHERKKQSKKEELDDWLEESKMFRDYSRAAGEFKRDQCREIKEKEEVNDKEALRLSELVHKPPEEREKTEQSVYLTVIVGEQDRQFDESLQQDRMKEDKEARRQKERVLTQSLVATMRSKEAFLPPEPPAGDNGVKELGVRMPHRGRVKRRFLQKVSVGMIKNWVDVELAKAYNQHSGDENIQTILSSFLVDGYDLMGDFPRRAFTKLEATVEQAGLSDRTILDLSKHSH